MPYETLSGIYLKGEKSILEKDIFFRSGNLYISRTDVSHITFFPPVAPRICDMRIS